jgi:hypothetical protein
MIALLERYRTVFQVLCSTTTKRRPAGEDPAAAAAATPELLSSFDCQRLIVHSLSEYWQHSVQHLIVLSEQLLVCGVISIQSVVAWVFFAQRHPERMTHLWKDILFASLRRALVQLQKQVDAVLHKPRAMAAAQTADRRAEDARQIEALHLERRELLVQCVANFQRLLADQLARRDAAAAAAQKVRESDRERIEEDIRLIIQRFLHFARVVRRSHSSSTIDAWACTGCAAALIVPSFTPTLISIGLLLCCAVCVLSSSSTSSWQACCLSCTR